MGSWKIMETSLPRTARIWRSGSWRRSRPLQLDGAGLDAPGRRGHKAQDGERRDALAAAALADQRHRGAARHVERDLVDRAQRPGVGAKARHQVANAEKRRVDRGGTLSLTSGANRERHCEIDEKTSKTEASFPVGPCEAASQAPTDGLPVTYLRFLAALAVSGSVAPGDLLRSPAAHVRAGERLRRAGGVRGGPVRGARGDAGHRQRDGGCSSRRSTWGTCGVPALHAMMRVMAWAMAGATRTWRRSGGRGSRASPFCASPCRWRRRSGSSRPMSCSIAPRTSTPTPLPSSPCTWRAWSPRGMGEPCRGPRSHAVEVEVGAPVTRAYRPDLAARVRLDVRDIVQRWRMCGERDEQGLAILADGESVTGVAFALAAADGARERDDPVLAPQGGLGAGRVALRGARGDVHVEQWRGGSPAPGRGAAAGALCEVRGLKRLCVHGMNAVAWKEEARSGLSGD